VSLDEVKRAMAAHGGKSRVIAEGAGALRPGGWRFTGKAGQGRSFAMSLGGNIDLEKFSELICNP